MKKLLPLSLTLITSILSPLTHAVEESNWYIGGLYSAQKIPLNEASRDFGTLGLMAGYKYNKYLSFETRFSKGISEFTYSNDYYLDHPNNSFESSIDFQASFLLKGTYSISDSLEGYLIAGFSKTQVETQFPRPLFNSDAIQTGLERNDVKFSESGFSYGIGLNYEIFEQVYISIECHVLPASDMYTRNDSNWNSINIGVNYNF